MMPIERADWATDPPVAKPETPASDANPAFSAEDLALLDADDSDEADDSALHRKLLADGVVTPEELGRIYGLSPEEIDALSKPEPEPVPRKSVKQELDEITALRKSDPKRYSSDEVQQRHRELIERRQKLEAEANERRTAEKIDIAETDPALAEEWENAGGVEYHYTQVMRSADRVLDELPPEEHHRLESAVAELPYAIRREVIRFMALEPGRGAKGAASILDLIESRLSPEQQTIAEEWTKRLTAAQANAILKGLAG